jgi:hypothetical protein
MRFLSVGFSKAYKTRLPASPDAGGPLKIKLDHSIQPDVAGFHSVLHAGRQHRGARLGVR